MLSRIAEELFWLGRYVERAENVARFLDVHYHARLERSTPADEVGWQAIVSVSGDSGLFEQRHGAFTEDHALSFLITDLQAPNSIASCLRRARQNARGIREHLSVEMWEELNKFYIFVAGSRPGAGDDGDAPHAFLQEVKTRAYLFAGVTDATLLHDEGWQFLRAGTYLERIAQTARIVSIQNDLLLRHGGGPPHRWIALLKSCSAFEAYRRVYAGPFTASRTLELLLLDRDFPRSALFCATQVGEALAAITGSTVDRPSTQSEREASRLRTRLALTTMDEVWGEGPQAAVARLVSLCNRIGEAVSRDFFTVTAAEAGSVTSR